MHLSARHQSQLVPLQFFRRMFRRSSQNLVRHALEHHCHDVVRNTAHERCDDACVVAEENVLRHHLFLQPLLSPCVSCCPLAPNPTLQRDGQKAARP